MSILANKPHWVMTGGYPLKYDNGYLTGFRKYKFRDINPGSSTFDKRVSLDIEDPTININNMPQWEKSTTTPVEWEKYSSPTAENSNDYVLQYYTGYKLVTYVNKNPNFPGKQVKQVRTLDIENCPNYISTPLWIYEKDNGMNSMTFVDANDEELAVLNGYQKRNVKIYYDKDDCDNPIEGTEYAKKIDMNPNSASYLATQKVYLKCNGVYKRPKDASNNDVFDDSELADDYSPYALFSPLNS